MIVPFLLLFGCGGAISYLCCVLYGLLLSRCQTQVLNYFGEQTNLVI